MHETMSRRQPGNLTFTVAFVAFEGHRLWVPQRGVALQSPPCAEGQQERQTVRGAARRSRRAVGPGTCGPAAAAAGQWQPAPSLRCEFGTSARFAPEVRPQALTEA